MNIGVDIDNTITNTRELIIDYVQIFAKENNLETKVSQGQYSLEKSLHWETATTNQFFNKYLADIYRDVSPKPNALEVLHELQSNHSLFLITSRNQRDPIIEATTQQWLSTHQVPYDVLVMNNTENMHHFSKLQACQEHRINVMIEDHHDLSLELSRFIPVIMFDYPYNAHLNVNNIIRVKDWLEVREALVAIESREKLPD